MISTPIVKICGVTTVADAVHIAQAGADFIGLVFHSSSKRYVNLKLAREIVANIPENIKPVAVCVNHSAQQMQEICGYAGIQHLQCHGDKARVEQIKLPANIHRIIALPVSQYGQYELSEDLLESLIPERDWLMFDSTTPGVGNAFNWDSFTAPALPFRWALAGGLNLANINQAKKLHADMFDVSSGVESSPGIKDMKLINQFINQVKKEDE